MVKLARALSPLLSCIGLSLACASGPEGHGPRVISTHGDTVIEYAAGLEGLDGSEWMVSQDLMFSIGDSSLQLYRVGSALFLSDGSVVVANGGAHELLFLDPAGQLRFRVGDEGGGPGQFQQLSSLSLSGADSVVAYDARQQRVSVFDRNGRFVRAVTLRGLDTLGRAEELGALATGELVGAFHRRTAGSGLVRDSLAVVLFDAEGEPRAMLGTFPHLYTDWGPHTVPGRGIKAPFPLPVAFSALTALAVRDSSVIVGLADSYQLISIRVAGTRRTTHVKAASASITDSHRQQLFAFLSSGRMGGPELEILRDLRGPTLLPFFGSEPLSVTTSSKPLLVTDNGDLWVEPFRLPQDTTPARWSRFDAAGFYEGTVVVPASFRPTAVRDDVVLGVYQDSLGVEHIGARRTSVRR